MQSATARGRREAVSPDELAALLRQEGRFLESCREVAAADRSVYRPKINELSEFSAELSTMLASGIPLVRGGAPLSQALREVDGFVPKLASVALIGEEAGRLDEMLDNMADGFDFESEKAIDRLIAMLEPAMIVLLAVGVGIVMVSVLLPLYTMYQNIG